jgi:hypothetical protein
LWHTSTVDDKFFGELEEEDARIAARVKLAGCPHCEGRLDRADYPRKPRGGDLAAGGERLDRRISLCCAREGCRRRATPPSVVFLGRRVYLGIALLKASLTAAAARSAPPPSASPPSRTVRRWLWWFREVLPRGIYFAAARGRLWPPIEDAADLPGALVERFAARTSGIEALRSTLRFLAPTTTRSVADGARFVMVGE